MGNLYVNPKDPIYLFSTEVSVKSSIHENGLDKPRSSSSSKLVITGLNPVAALMKLELLPPCKSPLSAASKLLKKPLNLASSFKLSFMF